MKPIIYFLSLVILAGCTNVGVPDGESKEGYKTEHHYIVQGYQTYVISTLMKDGTHCVVLFGTHGNGAISCDWNK